MNNFFRKLTQITHRKRRRQGTASVELAICLPVFFIVLIGNVELGRGLMTQQVLINAAREGTRACIVGGLTAEETETIVQEYAQHNMVPGVSVTVLPEPTAAALGEPIAVTVSIEYADVSFFVPQYFAGDAELTARSTMRKEREN